MVDTVSASLARRIALAAQGFGAPHPATVGTRQLNLAIDRLGLLQIDSVNVFERSHYLPLYARLGAYDKSALDRLTFSPRGRYVEFWAHEAALIPREWWPLFRWRMDGYRERDERDPDSWASSHRDILDWLRAELAEKGPLAASQVEHDANARTGPWWGWSDVKIGLEVLFRWGEVVSAGRSRFERVYGLAEHLMPSDVLGHEVPKRDAQKRLLAHAARAHGIATTSDLADYFRLKKADVAELLHELADEGALRPVAVEGWKGAGVARAGAARTGTAGAAWLHTEARLPAESTPPPCSLPSTPSCGSARARCDSSTSTTASRSTRPR